MVKIVAQIDTPSAIRNYHDLLRVADAIMVSRTNLGMVIKPEKVCPGGGVNCALPFVADANTFGRTNLGVVLGGGGVMHIADVTVRYHQREVTPMQPHGQQPLAATSWLTRLALCTLELLPTMLNIHLCCPCAALFFLAAGCTCPKVVDPEGSPVQPPSAGCWSVDGGHGCVTAAQQA